MRQLQPGALLVLDWRCLTGARFLAKINGDSERGSLGNTMIKLLIVGLGGFAGAIARYTLSGWVHRHYHGAFPCGTLFVNVVGCMGIGFLMVLAEGRLWLTPNLRLLLTVGFLGALTTFSTFGFETLALLEKGAFRAAALYVVGSLVLGLGGVFLGRLGARLLLR